MATRHSPPLFSTTTGFSVHSFECNGESDDGAISPQSDATEEATSSSMEFELKLSHIYLLFDT
jgi:hypothetical protein